MKNIKIMTAFMTVAVLGLMLCGAAIFRKSDCKKKAETFLAGMLKGEIDKSYDEILPQWLKEARSQEVQVSKLQTKETLDAHGKLLDYEFIKQKTYGESIVRLVYVLKSERLPFTWEFHFYKASSEWDLVNIRLSQEYDLLADK